MQTETQKNDLSEVMQAEVGITAGDSAQLLERLAALEAQVRGLMTPLFPLQGTPTSPLTTPDPLFSQHKSVPPMSKAEEDAAENGWLTTEEAYQEAVARGWQGGEALFKRQVRGKRLHPELVALGLEVNAALQEEQKKVTATRWLRFTT